MQFTQIKATIMMLKQWYQIHITAVLHEAIDMVCSVFHIHGSRLTEAILG